MSSKKFAKSDFVPLLNDYQKHVKRVLIDLIMAWFTKCPNDQDIGNGR